MQTPPIGRRSLLSPAIFLLLSLALTTSLSISASAQPAAETASDIAALRGAVEASTLDETQRNSIRSQLDAASAHLREAEAFRQEAASLQAVATSQATAGDRDTSWLEVDPEKALEEWVARLPNQADAETLERMLQQQRRSLDERSAEIERVEAVVEGILARPADIPAEIAALGRRADELAMPAGEVDGEPDLLRKARALDQTSELERVEAKLELRRVELETSLARQRLNETRLDELRARHALETRRAEWLEARIAERSQEELQLAASRLTERETSPDAKAASDASAQPASSDQRASSLAGALASKNRALGDDLLAQNVRLERDRQDVSEEEQARDAVTTALRESRTRLALGGSSEAVGRWLWSERRRLERSVRLASLLEERRGELAELRLQLVMLGEEERELDDLPVAARKLREANRVEADDEGESMAGDEALIPLLAQRVELLGLLEPILERRVKALEQSELALQERLEATQAMRQLLDRHLLWTPSHAPVDTTWLERAPDGVSDLFKPSRWTTTIRLTGTALAERPIVWIAACSFSSV